ncbi:MAG: hypothetical protein J6T00_03340 [Bacteroidaceae bacterium]|nr:hypothetical protein [Bacteroidaceae bacterium]
MTQVDEMFNRLQGQMPMLENPDEMVENIMSHLPDREDDLPKKETKQHAVLMVLRTITSAAAILLIGLFVYVNQPVKTEAQNAYAYTADFPHSSTLEQMYTRCLQASQPKPISYTQIKRMLYAKN